MSEDKTGSDGAGGDRLSRLRARRFLIGAVVLALGFAVGALIAPNTAFLAAVLLFGLGIPAWLLGRVFRWASARL